MDQKLIALVVILGLAGCGGGGSGAASVSPPTTPNPPPVQSPTTDSFRDVTAASNISYVVGISTPSLVPTEVHRVTFGGAAAGDCDRDGDIDLFITYGDAGPNRLYLNQLDTGNPLQFSDSAAAAGVAYTRDPVLPRNDRHSGPAFADMDGDGDLDLFVGGLFGDQSRIYQNNGDCTFEDVSAGSGIEGLLADNTISAAFGDYDLDGDLDMFLAHWGSFDEFPAGGESEHLFRNVSAGGSIQFENVSLATGVTGLVVGNRESRATRIRDRDYTYTPTFARINDDLWPDVTLAADFGTTQLLLSAADGSGVFVDGSSQDVHAVQYGMGSALGDIDFDGDLDWFVTSIYSSVNPVGTGFVRPIGNFLYQNPGGDFSGSRYDNIADIAHADNGAWGWAACFLDVDNDTDLDIYHTNGWHTEFLNDDRYETDASRLFVSDAANGTLRFTESARDFGLDDRDSARGIVCADFDNDGDVDILQLTNDAQNSASLWQNDTGASGNNFLRVQLVGLPPNTEAAGARIHLRIGTRTQMREIMIGSNYTSQNPGVQVFGLGTSASVDELRVEWPALVPAAAMAPVQPAATSVSQADISMSLGIAGETLYVCHPELVPVPAVCN